MRVDAVRHSAVGLFGKLNAAKLVRRAGCRPLLIEPVHHVGSTIATIPAISQRRGKALGLPEFVQGRVADFKDIADFSSREGRERFGHTNNSISVACVRHCLKRSANFQPLNGAFSKFSSQI